jgi:7,8-dihydropterin-6-yl-methyl-4-(beta-D-ribofuranosyl)aminobenzene 5'-phosphate synthase
MFYHPEKPVNRHIPQRALAVIVLLLAGVAAAETPNRVTILYDSFGKSPLLTMDWGFAALVEYRGKRILFDTGNNARIFEHNVKALGVDLRNIDFVVISHRHADHISGITYLLTVNPKVQIYVPDEPWGLFARGVKNDFYRKARRHALLRRPSAGGLGSRYALAGRQFHPCQPKD